ncbi:MAG: hypothetical protein BRD23_08030 [Halobacteriales archaeon SW_9_67_25]|nr:MAG: hypothetical protein BRD23_08030 [Halobacteriales archaeon SW_9_67_25]
MFRPFRSEPRNEQAGDEADMVGIRPPFTGLPSFPREHLSGRPPYQELGTGRNGADSVPSYRGGLSAHSNETISGTWSRTSDARTVRNVVTVLRTSATVNSADACWRPRG